MTCYRDMTFCEGNGCLAAKGCHRYLTEDIYARAQAANMEIARFAEPEKLKCYEPPVATSESP